MGDTNAAAPILNVLERTTVVAGGTFITKEYDAAPNIDASSKALKQLSEDVGNIVRSGAHLLFSS